MVKIKFILYGVFVVFLDFFRKFSLFFGIDMGKRNNSIPPASPDTGGEVLVRKKRTIFPVIGGGASFFFCPTFLLMKKTQTDHLTGCCTKYRILLYRF